MAGYTLTAKHKRERERERERERREKVGGGCIMRGKKNICFLQF
jgi:hypothetical protein